MVLVEVTDVSTAVIFRVTFGHLQSHLHLNLHYVLPKLLTLNTNFITILPESESLTVYMYVVLQTL